MIHVEAKTMAITLDLKPEVEERVRAQAEARGMSPESYLAEVIEARTLPTLSERPSPEEFKAFLEAIAEGSDDIPVSSPEARTREGINSGLPGKEAALLERINEGLPAETWQRYHDLKAKRDARTLTQEEHAELISISDSIEEWNARRLAFVAALARLRGVPFPELVRQLGLTPSENA
jgi:hypothetical protein